MRVAGIDCGTNSIRLLIADDVGIGKTVEALLIARELLDRAEVQRMAVLCPPHLAEQWQDELRDKFHIEAELVLSSTARRLDRVCGNRSVFDVFPYTIVSLDYIKSERHREHFLSIAPECIVVDEAHTCSAVGQGKQLRFELLQRLAADESRHLILLTATPHSGDNDAFYNLLSLLRPEFSVLRNSPIEAKKQKSCYSAAPPTVNCRRCCAVMVRRVSSGPRFVGWKTALLLSQKAGSICYRK